MNFSIRAENLSWLEGSDEREDKCLHGKAIVTIGTKYIEYDCTVSATALYLLKSLESDKTKDAGYFMLPCCGHFYIPSEDLTEVYIDGCGYGEDFEVIHMDGGVNIIRDDASVFVPIEKYKREVFSFCDAVKTFYDNSLPKVFSDGKDDFERRGYTAYWNEFMRRRHT